MPPMRSPLHIHAPRSRHAETYEALRQDLLTLRADLVGHADTAHERLDRVHPEVRDSACNLLHYLGLRRRDLRPLQARLEVLGLSSLGRAEAHVVASVDAVLDVLHRLMGHTWRPDVPPVVDFGQGQRLLARHADRLLGPTPAGRGVRIMVTMPGEAATDPRVIHDLLRQGMDVMRINCAHDTPEDWARMIGHLREAEAAQGRACRVVMDVPGPKLRTGPLVTGPRVVKVKPRRDAFGCVVEPARVWLTDDAEAYPAPEPAAASLPVPGAWLAALQPGERLRCRDARASKRTFRVMEVASGGCWATSTKTAYLVPGTRLRRLDAGPEVARDALVGTLPPREMAIHLDRGDRLLLTRDREPGRPAVRDADGRVAEPACIGCTLPGVLDDVRVGEAIWFDDGQVGGIVEAVHAAHLIVRVDHVRVGGRKLRAGKGINLPDSRLRLPALTDEDRAALPFIAEHADAVALSFASTAADVEQLHDALAQLTDTPPAVILKIETRQGFENLPALLLAAMRAPGCGVMIARGDLAVECGFERLAEVQEEILWICEAAHVPVIWATQVLEHLAKDGLPSRAEITDAAMGHRAECVMLNKGPHIPEAVEALDDILRRMQAHQVKKRALLRELHLAHTLLVSSS